MNTSPTIQIAYMDEGLREVRCDTPQGRITIRVENNIAGTYIHYPALLDCNADTVRLMAEMLLTAARVADDMRTEQQS